MNKETGYLHATDELRKLIIEHPELPLLVFGGENATDAEHLYTVCGKVSAEIGEFLDYEIPVDPTPCFTSREELKKYLENTVTDERSRKQCMDESEPYWKPCIVLYVDN